MHKTDTPAKVASTDELGQLPEPVGFVDVDGEWHGLQIQRAYTSDQMRAYAAEQLAAAGEQYAKLCEELSNDWHGRDGKYALEDVANKIRASLASRILPRRV